MSNNLDHNQHLTSSDSEFMLEPVPKFARRSTWKQILVWVGFGYVLTGLFVGGTLAGAGGTSGVNFGNALIAITIGMGILLMLTILMGIAAQKTGLSLALLSRYSYGYFGSNLPLIIMSILTLGWFASITGMVGQIWSSFTGNISGVIILTPANFGFANIPAITLENFLACFIWGIIFTFTAYKGIQAIENVAIPIAPVILLIALFVGFAMLNEGGGVTPLLDKASEIDGMELGTAITLVMGSWIAGAIMGIDLFRYNKNVKAVIYCAVACFVLTNPLLNIVGYIGAIQVGQYNYMEWMVDKGLLLGIIGLIAWTTSLWTTNNAELYCNSLYTGPVLKSIDMNIKREKLVLIIGVLGTLLGSLGFYQMFFANFITILGAAFLPLAGPIIMDYYLVKKQNYNLSKLNSQPKFRLSGIISFVVGAFLGLTLEFVWSTPFGISSGLIALIFTCIIYLILYPLFDKKHDSDLQKGELLNEQKGIFK